MTRRHRQRLVLRDNQQAGFIGIQQSGPAAVLFVAILLRADIRDILVFDRAIPQPNIHRTLAVGIRLARATSQPSEAGVVDWGGKTRSEAGQGRQIPNGIELPVHQHGAIAQERV